VLREEAAWRFKGRYMVWPDRGNLDESERREKARELPRRHRRHEQGRMARCAAALGQLEERLVDMQGCGSSVANHSGVERLSALGIRSRIRAVRTEVGLH